MQIPIIVVADDGGRFISAIESQRGQVSVVRHVHDIGEMLGVAQSGIARAVLVVTQTHEMTQSLVSSLHQLELSVCLVADMHSPSRLSGVTFVDSLADTQEIIDAIEESVNALMAQSSSTPALSENHENAEPVLSPSIIQQAEPSDESEVSGKLISVWGPLGATGKTTLATHLAAAYADAGYRTCLVDADTYGASASAVLGLTDDYSSLAQLCHQAERGPITKTHLKDLTQTISHKDSYFDIITGINRADRWAEIRKTSLQRVYETLKGEYDLIIADTAFCLEEDEVLAFDAVSPQRNDATLTSLHLSDGIVLVGLADVVGVPRLIKAYDQLTEVIQPHEMHKVTLVFNRVRAEAIGPSAKVALEHSWQRFGPEHPIDLLIAEDTTTADKARLLGKTVLESAPASQLGKDLLQLRDIISSRLNLGSYKMPVQGPHVSEAVVEKKKLPFFFLTKRKRSGKET